MTAKLKSETANAAEVARYDADRRGDVRGQRRRAGRQQRGKCYKGPTAGDAVGDARTHTGQQIDRETPPQWNGGVNHCRSLLKVKSLRTGPRDTRVSCPGHLPLSTCTS